MPRKLAVSAMNASLCGRRGTPWKTPKKQNKEESRNIRYFLGLVHSVSLVKGNVANVHCAADEGARKRPDDGCL